MLYTLGRPPNASIPQQINEFLMGLGSFMGTIGLLFLSPLLPFVIFLSFVLNYVILSQIEKRHKGIKSIFLYTCAIFYKLAFAEMCQFIDEKGDSWKARTRYWAGWAKNIQRPIHMLLLCAVIAFTYFVGEHITEKTERSTLYKQYVRRN